MNGTAHFKTTIQTYLEHRASYDILFSEKYKNPAKSIDECVRYIIGWVKQSGCNGFTDEEIYSQAIHYYDENDIKIDNSLNACSIVVNHSVELTEEEKLEAKRNALLEYQQEELGKLRRRNKRTEKNEEHVQLSLF